MSLSDTVREKLIIIHRHYCVIATATSITFGFLKKIKAVKVVDFKHEAFVLVVINRASLSVNKSFHIFTLEFIIHPRSTTMINDRIDNRD